MVIVRAAHGRVRGSTIQLADDLGLADGQEVEVIVRVRPSNEARVEAIQNSAGAMIPHWTAEDDRILAEIEGERRQPSSREIPG